MRYQVPQFIEVEDKIIGKLTAKQFIYLAGAAGVGLASFSTLPFILAVLATAPVGALALALAFYKVNEQPFLKFLENGFKYLLGSKLYLWNAQRRASTKDKASGEKPKETVYTPKLSDSKLRDLAWSLNIKDRGLSSEE